MHTCLSGACVQGGLLPVELDHLLSLVPASQQRTVTPPAPHEAGAAAGAKEAATSHASMTAEQVKSLGGCYLTVPHIFFFFASNRERVSIQDDELHVLCVRQTLR